MNCFKAITGSIVNVEISVQEATDVIVIMVYVSHNIPEMYSFRPVIFSVHGL